MYKTIRNLHLLFASFSLPFLVMYGMSAVQMSHPGWFQSKPAVQQRTLALAPGQADARRIARQVMEQDPAIRGEVTNVQSTGAGLALRIVVPGTVHDVKYDGTSGAAEITTTIAGVMGMLNRLHHWAGFWHEPLAMRVWAAAVALVSTALLLLGVTGLYMWFSRRSERRIGVVLLAVNLAFALTIIVLLRRAGP